MSVQERNLEIEIEEMLHLLPLTLLPCLPATRDRRYRCKVTGPDYTTSHNPQPTTHNPQPTIPALSEDDEVARIMSDWSQQMGECEV
jgi:hypothetical protein